MNGIMLCRGNGLEVFRIRALHPLHKPEAHATGEVRVLSIGLLSSAPTWITKDIYIGRPEGEAVVYCAVAPSDELMMLSPCLVRDGIGNIQHQILVPAVGYGDRLRKDCCMTCPGHAVQCLVPPVVFRYAQTRNGRGSVEQLRSLFLNSHA